MTGTSPTPEPDRQPRRRRRWHWIVSGVGLVLVLVVGAGVAVFQFGLPWWMGERDHNHVYESDVGALRYQVHLPPQYDGVTPLPVIMAIHGCGMSGYGWNSMKSTTRFNGLADLEGFAGGEYGLNQVDPEDPGATPATYTARQAWSQMGDRARQVPLLVIPVGSYIVAVAEGAPVARAIHGEGSRLSPSS